MLTADIKESKTVTNILDSIFSVIVLINATTVITSKARMKISVGISDILRYVIQSEIVSTVERPDIKRIFLGVFSIVVGRDILILRLSVYLGLT